MMKDELLVIDRTYELLKWFLGRLDKFPRSHRYGLGQRIESRLYSIFEDVGRAPVCERTRSGRSPDATVVPLAGVRQSPTYRTNETQRSRSSK